MKDLLGREVHVGDRVVINIPRERCLIDGICKKITPKGIKVDWDYTGTTFVAEKQFVIVN